MKRFSLILLILTSMSIAMMAQSVPQGINYQAVARDHSGHVLSNQNISLKVTLLCKNEKGGQDENYSEVHHVTTNDLGLFTLVIGKGTTTLGDFQEVPWSTNDVWIELAIDARGGSDFEVLNVTKLLTVPFAFHAATASEIIGDPTVDGDEARSFEKYWTTIGNANTNTLTHFIGTTDHVGLVFRTNNIIRGGFMSDGDFYILNNIEVGQDVNVMNDVNIDNNLNTVNDVNVGNDLNTINDANIGNNLNVTNYGTIGQSLTINDNLYVENDLSVDGASEINKLAVINGQPTELSGTLSVDGSSFFNDSLNANNGLYVNNNSPTYLTGTLTVDGATELNDNLHVVGTTDLDQTLNVDGATDLNSTLVVDGATDINNTLHVTGATDLDNTLNVDGATDLNSTLVVDGATDINNTLHVTGATDLDNTLNVDGFTELQNGLQVSNMTLTYLSGDLTVDGTTSFNNGLNVSGDSDFTGKLEVTDDVHFYKKLRVDGGTDLNDYLDVDGSTYLHSTLFVDGATELYSTLNVDGATDLNSTLEVDGATDLNSTLDVDGSTTLRGDVTVTSGNTTTLGGDLNVSENTTITKDLSVLGDTYIAKDLTVDGDIDFNGKFTDQVVIDVDLSGGQSSTSAYPLYVKGSEQGIAIEINESRDKNNNFITFWDTNGRQGRIEGQTQANLEASWDFGWRQAMEAADLALAVAEGTACGFQLDAGEVAVMLVEGIVSGAEWIEYNTNAANNIGVSFESGSGDYAEWLEKVDISEEFKPGDIVAVKDGKITKNTSIADHYMVVSLSPIVLGNMPEEGKEEAHEMVAFMGQVPAKVLGKVRAGDYIIPSGNNDGTGMAISKEDMTIEDYEKIVGVAWTNGSSRGINIINLAVGINTNDLVLQLKKQNEELLALRSEVDQIKAHLGLGSGTTIERSVAQPNKVVPDNRNNTVVNFNSGQFDFLLKKIEKDPELIQKAMDMTRAEFIKQGFPLDEYPQVKEMLKDTASLKAFIENQPNR